MKKLLYTLSLILLISGCGDIYSNTKSINSEQSATSTLIIEDAVTLEVTPAVIVVTPEPTRISIIRPRIILYIGDGMGSQHRLAGQLYSVGEMRELAMDSMPVSGKLITDSYGGELTESASAATSLATGQKTYVDVISLDIYGNQLKTILEYAQDLNMSVGLVSNKYITDATTAAFGAHVESNKMGVEVASQFIEKRIDLIFGGGEKYFLPKGVVGCHPKMGIRTDGRDLIEEAKEAGYIYICDNQAFVELDTEITTPVMALFADENMQRPYSPTLAEMTQTAIEILSNNPNGYFLVVEGAMIDIASHFGESQNVLDEMLGLDEAVKVGLAYAENDDNMLIIVTADHETGGLKVEMISDEFVKDEPFYMPMGTKFYLDWTTGGHTSNNVPVTALGYGSERLRGTNENTVVFDVMFDFLGLEN